MWTQGNIELTCIRAQELCKGRGGRPGLPVPNSPYGLCGRKASLNLFVSELRSCVKVEVVVPVIVLMVSGFPSIVMGKAATASAPRCRFHSGGGTASVSLARSGSGSPSLFPARCCGRRN